MRPDQEPSIEFSPMTPDDHPAADHHLPIEPAIVQLLTEIRAQQNPVKGKIGSGLPAKRALGSNW